MAITSVAPHFVDGTVLGITSSSKSGQNILRISTFTHPSCVIRSQTVRSKRTISDRNEQTWQIPLLMSYQNIHMEVEHP